jgi:hypothetical protein
MSPGHTRLAGRMQHHAPAKAYVVACLLVMTCGASGTVGTAAVPHILNSTATHVDPRGPPVPFDWPQHGIDPARSCVNTAESMLTPATVPNLRRLWMATLDGATIGSPVLLNQGAAGAADTEGAVTWLPLVQQPANADTNADVCVHACNYLPTPPRFCCVLFVTVIVRMPQGQLRRHSVLFVATESGSVYAITAGRFGGAHLGSTSTPRAGTCPDTGSGSEAPLLPRAALVCCSLQVGCGLHARLHVCGMMECDAYVCLCVCDEVCVGRVCVHAKACSCMRMNSRRT